MSRSVAEKISWLKQVGIRGTFLQRYVFLLILTAVVDLTWRAARGTLADNGVVWYFAIALRIVVDSVWLSPLLFLSPRRRSEPPEGGSEEKCGPPRIKDIE